MIVFTWTPEVYLHLNSQTDTTSMSVDDNDNLARHQCQLTTMTIQIDPGYTNVHRERKRVKNVTFTVEFHINNYIRV